MLGSKTKMSFSTLAVFIFPSLTTYNPLSAAIIPDSTLGTANLILRLI